MKKFITSLILAVVVMIIILSLIGCGDMPTAVNPNDYPDSIGYCPDSGNWYKASDCSGCH